MGLFDGLKAQAAALPQYAQPQRTGLLGGIQNFLAQNRGQGNFVDRLGVFGAQLQDIGDGGDRAATMATRRLAAEQAAVQARARQALNDALRGASGSRTGQDGGAPAATSTQGNSLPSLRSLAPALLQADQAGIDVGDLVNILDKTTPSVQVANGVAYDPQATAPGSRVGVNLQNVNGTQIDTQDPRNANRFVPNVGEGQELVYDANQRPMVRMLPGYSEGRGQVAASVAGSTAAAQTPFQLETVTGPNGEQITTSRQNLLGGGPIIGQSEAQQQQAITEAQGAGEAATTRAQRQRDAPARIERYQEALRMIPQAITGPGADARLAVARGMAALGNQQARDQVAATEVYQNLINRDLGAIIKDMVGGANVSNADRMIAERVAGGDVNMTAEALTHIVQRALETQQSYLSGGNGANAPAARRPTPAEARAILRSRGVAGY